MSECILLPLSDETVRGFPYRRAIIQNVILEVKPEPEEYKRILERLCKKAGMKPDNHQVFVIGNTVVQMSDWTIWIGYGVREGCW